MNKAVLGTGVAIGAGLMYLADPQHGKRRRAMAKDKAFRALNKGGDAAGAVARDVTHRASGLAVSAWRRARNVEVDDTVIAERVRAALGRVVSHPRAIDVMVHNGTVALAGAVLKAEFKNLLRTVERVAGVRKVEQRLDVHEQPGNVPSLQGGAGVRRMTPELLQRKWAPATRFLVGASGAGMAIYGLKRGDGFGSALAMLGGGTVLIAATNKPASEITGVGSGRRAVDVQKTINLNTPLDEVFRFWSDYRNFPNFMTNVRDVRATSVDGRSHWVVSGPVGTSIEYDAVITEFRPNDVIAWKTVEGAPVEHSGTVRFDRNADGTTRVQVHMSYSPPAGLLGDAAARFLGQDLKTKMDEDLLRMKSLVETGNFPHDAARKELHP